MFNVGGGEILVVLLVALIVLGPDKLPETARKVGNVVGELRRMSAGFQNEMRSAFDETSRPTPPADAEPARPTLEAVPDQDVPKANDDPAA